jgi:signal transduction histidine kinase
MIFRRSGFFPFFTSIILTLVGISSYFLLGPKFRLIPFMLAYPVIYIICAFWGLYPAVVSILLWTFALAYFFFEPTLSIHLANMYELAHLTTFVFSSVLVSYFVNKKRRSEFDELEAMQRARKLEELHQARELFLNSLSHDLRTPLSVARLSSELALRTPNEGKRLEYVRKSVASLTRVEHMVFDLLDSGRISAGKTLEVNKMPFHLSQTMGRIRDSYTTLYGQCLVITEEDPELVLTCSENHILRALENLISNGLKFGDKTRPVEMGFRKSSGLINIWVKNYGSYIPEKDLVRIFTPFERLTSTTKEAGWGIGLNLVMEVARAHDGTVKVESSLDNGTTFHILIPTTENESVHPGILSEDIPP